MIKDSKINFIESQTFNTKKENENYYSTLVNKKARIIIRNLPFKNLSEEKVKEWFREYGDIEEVNLLKKEDGRFVGCGFVQFKEIQSAANAVSQANEKEISGRKVIVDWAIPKNVYVDSMKYVKQEMKKEADDKESVLSGEELPYWIDTRSNAEDWQDAEVQSEEDSEEEDFKGKESKPKKNKNLKTNDRKKDVSSNDVKEGRTLFVRNLPFSANDGDLRKCFSKFGALEYALVCVDKLTEHSKGSGFVKFKDKSSAETCLGQKSPIFLENNPLLLTLAVSKDDLENKKINKTGKDSRNLYLAKEGVITAGSLAARGVSAADMAKRLEIEQWKSQMLKNLNMFISDRRLVVHNLPTTYDDAQLKALFQKHAPPNSVISEAKVMREKKKFERKTGLGMSKEYGFVTFTTHEAALAALRNLNNNPNIFTPKKRPIVAFSIESKAALNLKKRRLEKSRIKLGIDTNDSSKNLKMNKKQRRFIKRRQKIIEKRREAKKLRQEGKKVEESTKKRKMTDDDKTNDSVAKKRKISEKEQSKIDLTGVCDTDSRPKRKKNKKKVIVNNRSTNSNTSKKKNLLEKELDQKDRPQYCGAISVPGQKVKLRSRFKLKNQARIHKQQMKQEKSKRKKMKLKKCE